MNIFFILSNELNQFQGGRECSGVLKGFDPLLNLVLDNTTEYLRDAGKKNQKFCKTSSRLKSFVQ